MRRESWRGASHRWNQINSPQMPRRIEDGPRKRFPSMTIFTVPCGSEVLPCIPPAPLDIFRHAAHPACPSPEVHPCHTSRRKESTMPSSVVSYALTGKILPRGSWAHGPTRITHLHFCQPPGVQPHHSHARHSRDESHMVILHRRRPASQTQPDQQTSAVPINMGNTVPPQPPPGSLTCRSSSS